MIGLRLSAARVARRLYTDLEMRRCEVYFAETPSVVPSFGSARHTESDDKDESDESNDEDDDSDSEGMIAIAKG